MRVNVGLLGGSVAALLALGFAVAIACPLAMTFAAENIGAKPSSRRDGRIAFLYGESGDLHPAQLTVMDADGKNRRDVPGYFDVLYPSLSPDGRFIAFQGYGAPSISVVNVDGRPRSRPIVRKAAHADWSPNGRSIAFERAGDIWVVSLNDHRQRRLLRQGDTPRWAPDGKRLAFQRDRGQICNAQAACVRQTELWVLDIAAHKARLLARNGGLPNWSPDGQHIVFQKWRDLGYDFDSVMYVTRADGGGVRRLFAGYAPVWSPNGQEIAFIGRDQRHHYVDAVIRARLDGSHRRVLFGETPACGCGGVDWTR